MAFGRALVIIIILESFCAVLGIFNYGWTIEGLQAVTRFSGRLSLGIFSLIFLFHRHPVVSLSKWLSDKYFMVFAIAHGIHLLQLLSYLWFSNSAIIPVRLAGGFLAYSLIFAMPFAQQLHDENKLNDKRFNQLSLVYIYYVWFIFFMTYLPRVRGTLPAAGGSYKEFVVLLGWVSLLMGIKWSQLFSKPVVRRKKS